MSSVAASSVLSVVVEGTETSRETQEEHAQWEAEQEETEAAHGQAFVVVKPDAMSPVLNFQKSVATEFPQPVRLQSSVLEKTDH